MTRFKIVAIGAAAALLLGVALLLIFSPFSYQRYLGDAVALPSIKGDLLFLDAKTIVRRGPTRVVVLRLSPPMHLVPHHYQNEHLTGPTPIEEWSAHLKAPVVFNAGQFDEGQQHLGWLKGRNVWLSSTRKRAWMGVLVSGPKDPAKPWGGVVDLLSSPATIVDEYANVVQSMMLVDHTNQIRVRNTDITACRTVVAEDKKGRLLVIVTEGATTLADLAAWLPNTGLDLVRAMNLDGGVESQLLIRTPEISLTFYGQYGTGTTLAEHVGQVIHYPLPAVVAWYPSSS
jgi:hypothetical protein